MIWEPMLPSDWGRPGGGVLARISDARAAQFWDKDHLLARQLKHDMQTDPEHPRPRCCEQEGILWDLVAVYPRQARWENSLPRAAYMDGPVWKAAKLSSVLSELLTAKQTAIAGAAIRPSRFSSAPGWLRIRKPFLTHSSRSATMGSRPAARCAGK